MDSVLKKSDSLHQLAQLHITMGTCIHGVTWHAEFMKHLCIDLWVWCKHISSWQSAGGGHVSHPRAQHLPRLWDDSRLSNELPHPEGQKVYTVHKLFFYYVQTHVHLSSCLIILSYSLTTHGASWQYSTHKSPSVFLTPKVFFSVQGSTQALREPSFFTNKSSGFRIRFVCRTHYQSYTHVLTDNWTDSNTTPHKSKFTQKFKRGFSQSANTNASGI